MTDLERQALLLAAATIPPAVRNDRAMELGMTPARHAQLVNSLLERPDVEAAHPREVHRLKRLRDARRIRRRSA